MSESYSKLIVDLQSRLDSLQGLVVLQTEIAPEMVKDWQRSLQEIQAFFRQQIVNTSLEISQSHLSLQVEIDKQLKMLGVDLNMLQTSRNPATWQKRHQQASDRFIFLQKYCQMHTDL